MVGPLGKWTVDFKRRIGKGGFSKVYRCNKTDNLALSGAMKVFNKSTAVNTYEKEVSALTNLAGAPHTPKMLDHGRDSEGRLCIVTELVHGSSLNVHFKENGPLTLPQTLKLLGDILELLRYAHGRGLVHMDIQSPNIMVGEDGNFSLLDWGTSQQSQAGRIETISANKDVVAPECFYGTFSSATDFYSLAWLAVYALSGRLPYHCEYIKDKAYRTLAHCLEKPEIPECLPRELRPLLYNWLSKNPADRQLEYNFETAMDSVSSDASAFVEYRVLRQLKHEFSYLQYGAEHELPYAQYQYAIELLGQDRTDEALYWLDRAYRLGSAKAAYKLAITLEGQTPGDTEKDRIGRLLDFAADRGIARAQYEVAMRKLGENHAAALNTALNLLKKAAEGGYRRAQYALGLQLLKSQEGESEALAYMAMAAERGLKDAHNYLKQASA